MSFLINPYAFAVADGDFESIATVTVGSGGASSVDFTSIPNTYQHLQVRYAARSNRTGNALDGLAIRLNGNTGSIYAFQQLWGNSAIAVTVQVNATYIMPVYVTGAAALSSDFGVGIVEIPDYASASKNTSLQVFGGTDNNGSNAQVSAGGGLFINTAAVNTVSFFPSSGSTFVEHSTFALYGVNGT